jgi:hypothetical protein
MKKISFAAAGLLIILGTLFVTSFASAEPCVEGPISTKQTETVCNPSTTFFIDLGSHESNTFGGLLAYVIQGLIGLVGLTSVAFIIIGGFQYVTARGNEEQAESGKKTLTNAIIGLIIVVLSYEIVVVVVRALFNQAK